MDQVQTQPILRCEQCKKPFDQESSLRRHRYYCRSKSRKPEFITRPRSCISCARGKTRCDNKRPECSRCTAKALECHYPTNTSRRTVPKAQHVNDASATWQGIVPISASDGLHSADSDASMALDGTLVMPTDLEFTDFELDDVDWENLDLDAADFAKPQVANDAVGHPPFELPPPVSGSMISTSQATETPKAISFPHMSIPTALPFSIRSFVRRPTLETRTQRVANLVLHTLKSYPVMILRQNTLPPFIHPTLISLGAENEHAESLENCINLIHMINGGLRGSRKLFWKNVRLECQRMLEEHPNFDRWELLAAMQALCIYVVLRLDEGETEHNNFDALILATVTALATQLNRSDIVYNAQRKPYDKTLETSWRDWIFMESGRRLCVLFGVVNMLVDFKPSAMCDLPKRELIMAPLPAEKQLWNAGDEFTWKVERDKKAKAGINFGLATNGDLVKISEVSPCRSDAMLLAKPFDSKPASKSTANWEEWCSGMDELGGLVMLAASLTA